MIGKASTKNFLSMQDEEEGRRGLMAGQYGENLGREE